MSNSLTDNVIADTYLGLIKTCDNNSLNGVAGICPLTDGGGEVTSLEIGLAGAGAKVTGNFEATGTGCFGTFAANEINAISCLNSNGNFIAAHANANSKVVIGGDLNDIDKTGDALLTVIGNLSATNNVIGKNIVDKHFKCGTDGQYLKSLGSGSGVEWGSLAEGANCKGNVCLQDGCTGTSGTIAKFSGTTDLINSGFITENANGVGIGSNPGTGIKLCVDGKVQATSFCGEICSGSLCGDSSGDSTVQRNLTVNGTLGVSSGTTLANVSVGGSIDVTGATTLNGAAQFNGAFKDHDGNCGTSSQFLGSDGTRASWKSFSSVAVDHAEDADSLTTARTISLACAFSTSISFDGSADKTLCVTSIKANCIKTDTLPQSVIPDINAVQLQSKALITSGAKFNRVVHTGTGGEMCIGDEIRFHTSTGGSTTACICTNGSQMIFKNDSSYKFCGTLCSTGDIIAFASSDKNLKNNIIKISDSKHILDKVNGYSFEWNEKSDREGKQVGLIAQEVEEVLPTAVCTREDGTKALDYIQLIPVLVEEVKNLRNLINKKSSS